MALKRTGEEQTVTKHRGTVAVTDIQTKNFNRRIILEWSTKTTTGGGLDLNIWCNTLAVIIFLSGSCALVMCTCSVFPHVHLMLFTSFKCLVFFTKQSLECSFGIISTIPCRPRWRSWMRVRLATRRSRVRPPPRSATFFHGDWSWNIFYGHFLPSADSRRAVVSFWRKNVHNTG